MAKLVKVGNLGLVLEQRIMERLKRFAPGSEEMTKALTKIGVLIETETKLNIRRKKIIDLGALYNSVKYALFKSNSGGGVTVGSFGVPYAAIHEFGGPFTDRQRKAMFANLRKRGKLNKGQSKGVIKGDRIIARPYLRPAIKRYRSEIVDIIRGIYR